MKREKENARISEKESSHARVRGRAREIEKEDTYIS